MRRPDVASAILCLSAAVALAGCDAAPIEPPEPAAAVPSPGTATEMKGPAKPGAPVLGAVGPVPEVWVEPSDELRSAVAAGDIAVTDPDQMLGGLDLYVNPCWDVAGLTVRVAMMLDGEVVATAESEGGILLEADAPALAPPGPGEAVGGPSGAAGCRSIDPVRIPAGSWGASVAYPDPPQWIPQIDDWTPQPGEWIPAGELIPGPRGWGAWPKQWSFLKAKKAFLKAKKAFVPAVVVFDEAQGWFPGHDTPILAGGGFGTRTADGRPQLGGPVVVVGVMPGDNVSVMPGDNVNGGARVGVTFFAAGPDD